MNIHFQQWSKSSLGRVIVGTGNGRAFCAGGDVAGKLTYVATLGLFVLSFLDLTTPGVVEMASNSDTRSNAIAFFQREYVYCDPAPDVES